ncbi:hypothetical protein VNO77_08013 [Canavalia gladiata]|uniref:Uncharacterized protein n=1 Tax=Canavalia gladiata TaxID=3824 RepID=A0AAN9M8W8_CANGL
MCFDLPSYCIAFGGIYLFAVEMPSVLLMVAIRNVPTVRLVIVLGQFVKHILLSCILPRLEMRTNVSFDLRPSHAINMAVRCKIKTAMENAFLGIVSNKKDNIATRVKLGWDTWLVRGLERRLLGAIDKLKKEDNEFS